MRRQLRFKEIFIISEGRRAFTQKSDVTVRFPVEAIEQLPWQQDDALLHPLP